MIGTWLGWLIGAYLLGSVPFGFLLGRLRGIDIRTAGSGNIGATNLGRVLGRKWGIGCFALDVCKGLIPVLSYGLTFPAATADTIGTLGWLAIAAAAVVGHVFPVWLRFRGGKGVATGLGAVLGFWPVLTAAGLGVAVLWLVVTFAFGYVSLGSVVAAAALPVLAVVCGLAWGLGSGQVAVFAAVTGLLAALVIVRHRANLVRLAHGQESKAKWTGRA